MESLGIDFKLLLAQIFNFLVLFFVLKKFLYQPILKFLDERKKKIEESLINAQKIEERLSRIEEHQKEILKQARIEASKIISEGQQIAEKEKEKIIQEAKKQAEEEIKKASEIAKQELEKAKKELTNEAVSLAEVILKKVLVNLPDSQRHKLLEDILK